MKIHFTNYARTRHTASSPKSHYAGSEESLLALVEANLDKAKPGYRDGVILVPVPPEGFFSGVVTLKEGDVVIGKSVARAAGEDPYVEITAPASGKTPAAQVDIVLYSHDVLLEGKENESDAEWEIISINASPVVGDEPMNPIAMARNFLGRPGGTAATYTAEQFAKAILHWQNRCMAG